MITNIVFVVNNLNYVFTTLLQTISIVVVMVAFGVEFFVFIAKTISVLKTIVDLRKNNQSDNFDAKNKEYSRVFFSLITLCVGFLVVMIGDILSVVFYNRVESPPSSIFAALTLIMIGFLLSSIGILFFFKKEKYIEPEVSTVKLND